MWVFGALPCPQVKQHYDRRRAAGDKHAAAMRNLFNRFLGCLHHCLQIRPAVRPGQGLPEHGNTDVHTAAA